MDGILKTELGMTRDVKFIDDPNSCKSISFGTCGVCGCKLVYCPEFDSIWCIHCNSWTQEQCQDPDCERCNTQQRNTYV